MTYLAHIEDGLYRDVRSAETVEAYRALFAGTDTSGWRIVAVADASVEGTAAPVTEAAPLEWTAYEFKLRLTQAERIGIRAAAQQSPEVFDFMDLLETAAACGKMIASDDAQLNAGLDALSKAGLLGVGRKEQILGC